MDLESKFKPDLVRELLHKPEDVFRLPLMIVLDEPHQPIVQVWMKLVLMVYLIDDCKPLIEFGFDDVLALNNRRERPCREGEGNDSNYHEQDAEHLLSNALSSQVSITHCHDGRHDKVKGSCVQGPLSRVFILIVIDPVLLIRRYSGNKEPIRFQP